jgi:cystathionine gamma-lyase
MTDQGDSTLSVHAGRSPSAPGEPVVPGPVLASIYAIDPVTGPGRDSYGRPDNPTRRRLEQTIGALEGGDCRVFATGMAAVSAALFALARTGDRVVLPADGYYQTRAVARAHLAPLGIQVDLAPTAGPYPDLDGVRLVLVETPANPGLDVCDIAVLAEAAHAVGALLAVDNTTATPLGQRPLDLGADIVVASATKALTGHSDMLMGYVATRDPDILTAIRAWRDLTGAVPGGFDAWLALRSIGTLGLRLQRQSENAAAVAAVLAGHPRVVSVRWPGLPDDPSYVVAARQMRRMPGVVTFTLPSAADVARLLSATKIVTAATSFGGLHTTADRRAQWGDDTPEGLVRLSCGVEDTADLVADLTAALDRI